MVEIADYNPLWPEAFELEATRIRAALADRVLRLEHAGSTSVPGLPAKPVIDIILAVADSADEPAYAPPLEQAGYVLRIREPDWYQHRMFNHAETVVNLHVFTVGCPEIDQMLKFRDWLRTHPDDRDLYAAVKCDLAKRRWETIDEYAQAKSAVVGEILGRARRRPVKVNFCRE